MNRVVVTGMGVVSPLGNSVAEMSATLRAGRSAIGPLTRVCHDGLNITIGAEAKAFDAAAHFNDKQLGLLDRFSQLALVAARQAIGQSGIKFREELGAKGGVILGVGVGGMATIDENFQRLYAGPSRRPHPLTVPRLMISAAMSHITIEHGVTGPSFSVTSACASSNHAIGIAYQMVRGGGADAIITGGAESVFCFGGVKGWEVLRVMAPDTCRPFSKKRAGMVLGEGAAIFILENLERAKARGAEILAEVIGFGMASDAADLLVPSADGAVAAMQACLNDARLNPEEVEYINAHGTGTLANDICETKAIRTVFGDHANKLAVSSTKSLHGHLLGGAGAMELAATLTAMQNGFIPPTANYLEPDPDCDLDYVPNEAREAKVKVKVALSNSFAFGGHNAVLAVRR